MLTIEAYASLLYTRKNVNGLDEDLSCKEPYIVESFLFR